MIISQLRVTNMRAFREAEFNFLPGMNLLVGVNGVGKSTVLDAIRILLSQMMPRISDSTDRPVKFIDRDISINKDFLTAELTCELGQTNFSYSTKSYHRSYNPEKFSGVGIWLFPTISTGEDKPSREKVNQIIASQFIDIYTQHPLAVFFSPNRSIIKTSKSIKTNSLPQHREALKLRQHFNSEEFIDWWLAYEKLQKEGLASTWPILNALEEAIYEFISCSNLHVDEKGKVLLVKKAGLRLDVKQLSDGERGVLVLVLDLTRRLAEANPQLNNPAKEGKAIVLIDELDLHLHPRWQRTIVHQLTKTFPNCQFIATTHSPQIISEVQPESLTFLVREGEQVVVKPATQAYGLDTNWILDHLMDVPSRPELAQDLINQIENSLEEGQLDNAREEVQKLRKMLHGDDGEVVRLETSIYNLEALADEMDSEE